LPRQMARSAGIHLVIATQRPDAEIVNSKIKTNIQSRICFACASRHAYGVVLDKAINCDLAGKGDGLCMRESVAGLTRFQAPLIALSEMEERKIFTEAAKKWSG
jgi:DNA segregation ATPase FtsK/SpoIIIE, S-DNA-T family